MEVYYSLYLLGDDRRMSSWKEIRRLRKIVQCEPEDGKDEDE